MTDEQYRPDCEFLTHPRGAVRTCEKKPDSNGYWICHRCGSLWSEMLSGTGWIPLSCPDREKRVAPSPIATADPSASAEPANPSNKTAIHKAAS